MISRASRLTAERSGADEAWLDRYRWWGDAAARLFRDEPATKLDG
jgi:hypothetical protein